MFFYLVLYQHCACVYSYECNMELNSILVPPAGQDVSKTSLGRNALLETSPYIPTTAGRKAKLQQGSCNENGWAHNHREGE